MDVYQTLGYGFHFAHWYRLLLFSEQIAIVAGILQFFGYVLYIRQALRHELEPNPSTWLMFAYGTALLTALELDMGASMPLLILPIVCAVLSVYVAYECWKRGTLGWPDEWEDRAAFVADLLLTVGYIGAWVLLALGDITPAVRAQATLWFLVFSNATTLTAFTPLLRDAYSNPDHEHAPSWLVWSMAYTALGLATALSVGVYSPLMIYPVSNAMLHGLVAWLARPSRHNRLPMQRVSV